MECEDTVTVACLMPLWKKEGRSPRVEALSPRPSKRGSLNRLVSTLSDVFSSAEEDKIQAHRSRDLKKGRRKSSGALLCGNEQLLDVVAALEEERHTKAKIQEQLNLAMNMNTELKIHAGLVAEEMAVEDQRTIINLKSKLRNEQSRRQDAEVIARSAKLELQAVRAALECSRREKKQLEAELVEAAFDVLDHQKLQTSYQEATLYEKEARASAELRQMECGELRAKLKHCEETRRKLEKELHHLRAEASHWEDALDTLQDQLDRTILSRTQSAETAQSPTNRSSIEFLESGKLQENAQQSESDDSTDGIAEWHDTETEGIAEFHNHEVEGITEFQNPILLAA